MKSPLARSFVVALILWIPALAQREISELLYVSPVRVSGVVMDTRSNAIPSAAIACLALLDRNVVVERSVQTDVNGRFDFETLAPAIVVRSAGYESRLVQVGTTESSGLRVMMTPAIDVAEIATCSMKASCLSVGARLWFPAKQGISVSRPGRSIDASEREFNVKSGLRRFILVHGSGPSWGGPYPRGREVWLSSEYVEQTRHTDGSDVIDSKGKTRDGKIWRHVGLKGESAFYVDADPQAASAFDRMLDGVCIRRK